MAFTLRAAFVGFAAAMACAGIAFAQEAGRSYFYAAIDTDIEVRRDASILVSETQTYNFTGEYHLGFRAIPHKDISGVTDVVVSENGQPLAYSRSRLNKDDPASWGKYAVYSEGGATNVEWYYDLADKRHDTRTWTITHVAHGAVSFLDTHDELYWNLFTDYSVPVESVTARVHLPEPVTDPRTAFYTTQNSDFEIQTPDDRTFEFSTHDIAPGDDVTLAAGWQKGIVSEGAFWRDWLRLFIWHLLSVVLVLASLIFSVLYWYFTEQFHKGRGTIIPEYEPPRKLPPAMAQLIATERINASTWPATLVDLAVRGYLKIREDTSKASFLEKMSAWGQKDYFVDVQKPYADAPDLQEYEKRFLAILFEDTTTFSTKAFRAKMTASPSASMAFNAHMRELKKALYAETTSDTGAYEVPLTVRNWQHAAHDRAPYGILLAIALRIGIPAAILFSAFLLTSSVFFVGGIALSALIVYLALYRNPRLNTEGFILRDEWRGFKLYLMTAERYRLQNLTPDLFEKYLPYAMIFGIEKKWARAFETMHMPQPAWYAGAAVGSPGSGGGSGFSASVFSSSFATSFSSSFASSGAGGASGGGGGAGGGGGGGGGGAG